MLGWGSVTTVTFTPHPGTILEQGMQIDITSFSPPLPLNEYVWGAPVSRGGAVWKAHRYHGEVLASFDHDYLGTHLLMQVWDYGMQDHPDQGWQYVLMLHGCDRVYRQGAIVSTSWHWTIHREYDHCPSYAEVGGDIDVWLRAPEPMRFLYMDVPNVTP